MALEPKRGNSRLSIPACSARLNRLAGFRGLPRAVVAGPRRGNNEQAIRGNRVPAFLTSSVATGVDLREGLRDLPELVQCLPQVVGRRVRVSGTPGEGGGHQSLA